MKATSLTLQAAPQIHPARMVEHEVVSAVPDQFGGCPNQFGVRYEDTCDLLDHRRLLSSYWNQQRTATRIDCAVKLSGCGPDRDQALCARALIC
jgi:hypothetical protein